ncbi:MAG: pilus assembly PilX N-terminal domain-containing protein [Phycisphaerae bacterium]|nr:pilus assembly PilX N-terminal domain-containing protein [Phycisphaerae bacterium]
MKHARILPPRNRQGSVLVLSLIFITMFSALAVAMAAFSGANVQIAENLREADTTRACAESGLEVMRYWVSKVEMSGTIAASERFDQLFTTLQSKLSDAGITNILDQLTRPTDWTIWVSNVPLLSSNDQRFSAILTSVDANNVQIEVTGHYGSLSRTIRSNFVFDIRANNVFDFGVASKGPVQLSGNIDMEGVNIAVESNAYIETDWTTGLEIIGNSHIAGNVKLTNSNGQVVLQGEKAGIGGVTGEAATHPPYTEYGVPPSEFPEMVPQQFYSYVEPETSVLSPTMDTSAAVTLENIRIPAGMNPSFSGHATLKGVIWIERPNVVTFSGTTDVCAIIIGNGDATDNSGDNQIAFTGNVNSLPVSQLPTDQPKFAGLHGKVGTFVMAPGFSVSFGGNFSTLSGAIAANGIRFHGHAGGTINGSVINYSSEAMTLSGNSDLRFNRSGLDEVPAGFVPKIVLNYDRSSYSEVVL